jgi:hypothetical protein
MAIIRLGDFQDDTIVLHFGGSSQSIDAYTFAEALTGFADTALAVSATIDPGTQIEILVEATGPGSYRTQIRRIKKDYGGLLAVGGTVFWGVVSNVVYDATLKTDPKPEITVNSDEVIIKHGNDTIIVPRKVHEATEHVKKNPAVQRGLSKTFAALDADENVADFGITGSLKDPEPLIRIPRAEFPKVITFDVPTEEQPKERIVKERARVVVLKAWLNHAKRKWSFEWNGVPISAPIADTEFLNKLDRREILFGSGDALDVEITFKQNYDSALGIFVNDPNSFVITRVIRPVPRG